MGRGDVEAAVGREVRRRVGRGEWIDGWKGQVALEAKNEGAGKDGVVQI